MDIVKNLKSIASELPEKTSLVAVSKTKPASMVRDLFLAGHLDFGENKVQDLVSKAEKLPEAIRWHMIGHLQSNKVKYIAPFIHLIHSVDSLKLLRTIQKEGEKNERIIDCLLQVRIAKEETKFGMVEEDLIGLLESKELATLSQVKIRGLMGMATFTDDTEQIRSEFKNLKRIFEAVRSRYFSGQSDFSVISMGMSDDYTIALEEGSNMLRIGSLIFGPRHY
jgi:pyridoxal phosphate enzyme (YggS family)